jgi:hypothetical protein
VTCWLPFCVISSVVRVVEKRGVEVLECEKNCSKSVVLIFLLKDQGLVLTNAFKEFSMVHSGSVDC